jgi:hypothetical protein
MGVLNNLEFSHDGKYLAIATATKNVIILNGYEPFNFNFSISSNIAWPVVSVDFSNDSSYLIACGTSGSGRATLVNMTNTTNTTAKNFAS